MHTLSVRILERGLVAMETVGEVFVATQLWRAGRKEMGDGVPGRVSSKGGEAEAGLSMEYMQEHLERPSFRAELHRGEEHY